MNTKKLLVEAVEAAKDLASLNKRCLVVKRLAFQKAYPEKIRKESVHYCCKIQKSNTKKFSALLEDAEEEIHKSDIKKQFIPVIKNINSNVQKLINQLLEVLHNQEKLKIENYSEGIHLIKEELKLYAEIESLRKDALRKIGTIIEKYKRRLETYEKKLRGNLNHAKSVEYAYIGSMSFFVLLGFIGAAFTGKEITPTLGAINGLIAGAIVFASIPAADLLSNLKGIEKELKHHIKSTTNHFTWFIKPRIKKVNSFYSKLSKNK